MTKTREDSIVCLGRIMLTADINAVLCCELSVICVALDD